MINKHIQILIVTIGLLFAPIAYSQNVTRIELDGNKLTLYLDQNVIVYRVCSENILAANYRPNGAKDSHTLVIWKTYWEYVPASIDTTGDPIVISTSYFTGEIARSPFTFRLIDSNGKTIIKQNQLNSFPENRISFEIEKGNLYGITNNKQGTLTKNSGGKIAAGSQGGAGAPFLWSTEKWGLLCDSDGGTFSIDGKNLVFTKSSSFTKRDLDIYFISGTPTEIFSALTDITGKPPLFPKFSLGFLNTEWKLDESELLSDVRTYREKDIPIDAYILDFDWMAYGEDNYGEFRWGPKFPGSLTGTLQNTLDSLKLKLFGIRKPRIHLNTVQGDYCVANNFFVDVQTDYFTGKLVGRLNFLDLQVREWYWKSFAEREGTYDKGIIGYWNDEADEYGGNFMFMQMQRAQYEGQRSLSNKRVWSINRNFYLGAQRYAYAHWSGDIGTGFQSMAEQRTFMLSSINLGSSWWSMDTGGFHGTPSPENYIRWIQFATFVPIMRVHGTFGQEREPWNYGPTAETIARKYIKLRYALIPYIYSYTWQNHQTGVSIVRPLCFVYPDKAELANNVSQWFFGEQLLIRPVVEPSATSVSLYLPPGDWYDFHNGNLYKGPGNLVYPVTINEIPILVKAGAIIPMQPVGSVVDDPDVSTSLMKIICYPGDNGSFTLYEDDGETYDYENNIYCTTSIEAYHTSEKITINLGNRNGSYHPLQRDYLMEAKWLEAEPLKISFDDSLMNRIKIDVIQDSSVMGWAYNKNFRSVFIRFADDGSAHQIEVFKKADTEPPDIDSVKCTTDTTVEIFFSEKVVTGDDPNSAENINNYQIDNNISILKINASFDHRKVRLVTSPHLTGQSYTLTVSNIADLSSASNVMPVTVIDYSCDFIPTHFIIIQQGLDGYTGTSDAHIAEFFPDYNMGGFHQFEACRYAGDNDSDDKSMLIKFDLTGLQLHTHTFSKVELILTLVDTRFGISGKYLSCHRLLRDWNEGENASGIDGNIAQTGWVTWRSARHQQQLWHHPGADFEIVPEDEIFVENDIGKEYSWEITHFFHFWLDHPDSNFGVILRERSSSIFHGTKVFASSENEVQPYRPKLKLEARVSDFHYREDKVIPETYSLFQSYPNPFNSRCTIAFDLPDPARVSLSIFNIRGQKVNDIVIEQIFGAGHHKQGWDGMDSAGMFVASGLYFYTLTADQFQETRKMLMVK